MHYSRSEFVVDADIDMFAHMVSLPYMYDFEFVDVVPLVAVVVVVVVVVVDVDVDVDAAVVAVCVVERVVLPDGPDFLQT